ncbi:hypothetical protein ELH93_03720 [Rhizobium leguminosarum]|uniref:hypothetical protein n=1 Tax=Rhizobium leguminosarum TaxID=384 RepID=UPI0010323351|nr:hypothetical protein [Rhizobium leguminosarum]TAY31783.1 hypothetical protein ELH93_03720 [Rhizobium leguminosarum]
MKDHLVRVTFTTDELRKMPMVHSGFFVTSCLAINEIGLSLRLFLMSMNTRSKERPISDSALEEYAFCQHQMVERSLGSKVVEYLNMFGDYQTRCQRAKDTTLAAMIDPVMDTVRNSIRVGPAYKLAEWYRNKTSSHYNVSEITDLMMKGDIADEHNIYLHKQVGNASYLLGEQILLAKLAEGGKSPEDTAAMLTAYGKWVEDAARYVVDVHHSFSVALFQTFFPDKIGQRFEINPEPHLVAKLSESALPIFWDFSDLIRKRP